MTDTIRSSTINILIQKLSELNLHRPMRITRYEDGTELTYTVSDIESQHQATVRLQIEQFIGGGFAGQVYRVNILEVTGGTLSKLQAGQTCAMKILIPPSGKSKLFRDIIYRIGFQGPFQLQVNPAAARAGALWQKFIRRAAAIRFGDENTVVDIYGTFVDEQLGSCGELSEWIEGRTWRLEVDDHMDYLRQWQKNEPVDESVLGSPEYRRKKQFMADFVDLLHELGAHEFARQYEWSTCKSQPNCLKRRQFDDDPYKGLTAVDFRAGLALLPFLPMSPGDFKLIGNGLKRGSLVQFDRGNLKTLKKFMDAHPEHFQDMAGMYADLQQQEDIYRNSVPDMTHNHLRLLFSGKLWSTMLTSAVTGWSITGRIDEHWKNRLYHNKLAAFLFGLIGLIPFFGKVFQKSWARPDWRRHYTMLMRSGSYFAAAVRGKIIEKSIRWLRQGRITEDTAQQMAGHPLRYFQHIPLSILPAGLHRFITDKGFRREKLFYIFVRPFKLYFNADLREQWLKDMVVEGRKKHILTDEDAQTILSKIHEPFIQRYLVCLVLHLLTLPITQVVSVIVAAVFYMRHPEMPESQRRWLVGGILVAFQLTPISPGSFTRGLIVLVYAIRDRNFKDYNIALFLGFFKYIGYLAFPIQMAYRYPALSRFMAGHWATDATHIVPVFGERGALFEHWVYGLFYNWPLTIRRRMQKRAQIRSQLDPRFWHIPIFAALAAGIFILIDLLFARYLDLIPGKKDLWLFMVSVPMLTGAAVTTYAGGTVLIKRIGDAAVCGILCGIVYAAGLFVVANPTLRTVHEIVVEGIWRAFIFAVLAAIGAFIREITLSEPDLE